LIEKLQPSQSSEKELPAYRQIEAYLQDLLAGADYGPGDRIPSERDLAETLGRNRMTVRKAIEGLIAKGLLERHGTSGTRIPAPRLTRPLDPFASQGIRKVIQASGSTAASKLLHFEQTKATAAVAHRLQLPEGADIVLFRMLWTANDTAVCVDTVHLPLALVPDLAAQDLIVSESVYALLWDRYQVRAMRAEREIGVVNCSEMEGRLLGLDVATPCLSQWSLRFDEKEVPFEYVRSINHPKFVVFKTTLPDGTGDAHR
jgi:GntR family transcriptional regulator